VLKKFFNIILLANGISPLDENEGADKQDKWAERRKKYGERPWEDQPSKTADEHKAEDEPRPQSEK